jgi:hypothetical protein
VVMMMNKDREHHHQQQPQQQQHLLYGGLDVSCCLWRLKAAAACRVIMQRVCSRCSKRPIQPQQLLQTQFHFPCNHTNGVSGVKITLRSGRWR